MRKNIPPLIVFIACLVSTMSVAAPTDPNSSDFDPVAHMRRFDPDWNPPQVNADEIAKHPLGSPAAIRTQRPNR
jgi:hypothetical protein